MAFRRTAFFALALAFGAVGLASTASAQAPGMAERILGAWKGKKGDDMIVLWGAPASVSPLSGGAKLVVFKFQKVQTGPDLGEAAKAFGFGKAAGLLSQVDTSAKSSCVVNVKVNGKGLVEMAVAVENAGPQGDEYCSKVIRPPL